MNQVPWRRILERMDNEGHGGERGNVVDLRNKPAERRPHPNRSRPPQASPNGGSVEFEAELMRALRTDDRYPEQDYDFDYDAPPAPRQRHPQQRQPQQRTVIQTEGPTGRMRVPEQYRDPSRRSQHAPLPPEEQPSNRSGIKNVLAISLSALVVGVAAYQISIEWHRANGIEPRLDDGYALQSPDRISFSRNSPSQPDPSVTEPVRASAPVKATPETASDINLRPSITSIDEPTSRSAGTARPVEQPDSPSTYAQEYAAKIQASKSPPSDTPDFTEVTEQAGHISASAPERRAQTGNGNQESTEQIMLRRGHSLMKQGHVSGARIIFEHLAGQNSALGAFALAQSYDGNYLQSNGIDNVDADQKLAGMWYQKAAELTTGVAGQ